MCVSNNCRQSKLQRPDSSKLKTKEFQENKGKQWDLHVLALDCEVNFIDLTYTASKCTSHRSNGQTPKKNTLHYPNNRIGS